MQRFLASWVIVAWIGLAPAIATAEPADARPEAARPGAFCPPGGGCETAAPSPWNGAAFGIAAGWIAWQARRRRRPRG